MIHVNRVYDHEPSSCKVFLVDRLWPRGVAREDLRLEAWLKEVAPSTELRRWYSHRREEWDEFRRRYIAELDANPNAWQPLVVAARQADVTLLYSSRDRECNNAVVLRDYLTAHLSGQ